MREHALGSYKVDWELYTEKIENLLSAHASKDEIFRVLGSIFKDIDDFHGGFYYDGTRYGMVQPDVTVRQELQDGFRIGAKVKSLIVDEMYAYIFIPPVNSFASDRGISVGQEIDSIICAVSPGVKGWIVDLRLNLGGNMYPMICGLQSILGDGKVGSFVTNHETIEWTLSKGTFKAGTDSVTIAGNLCDFKSLPVAVLISQLTSSSGEAVAIAFKGRKKTILIGEPTSGYISVLNRHQLNSHAMLLLPEALMCDRNGDCYTTNVTPDLMSVQGDHLIKLERDVKVSQAISWIKERLE